MSRTGPNRVGEYIWLLKDTREGKSRSSTTYLSQRELVAATKKRAPALGIGQERLNLLHDASNQLLGGSITVRLRGRSDTGEKLGHNLVEECIDEERQACAVQRVVCRAR